MTHTYKHRNASSGGSIEAWQQAHLQRIKIGHNVKTRMEKVAVGLIEHVEITNENFNTSRSSTSCLLAFLFA